MKKIILLAILALSCIPDVSTARVGETLDECIARYGPIERIANATGPFFSEYPQYCFT